MEKYEAEDFILAMAEMVYENRQLREENERLYKVEKEYHQSIIDRCRASEEASQNMLRSAIVGISIGKDNMELSRELIDYI